MGKNKQATCKVCFKVMRSDNVKQHMKVHIKYQPEIQPKSNEEICRELVLEMVDKVMDPSPTQEKTGSKRKFEDDVNQPVFQSS